MLLRSMFHHTQFPAMPLAATMPVTASGVSAAKVVATMLVPASHQETLRPPTKNSSVDPVAWRRYQRPMPRLMAKYAATIAQSNQVRCMKKSGCRSGFRFGAPGFRRNERPRGWARACTLGNSFAPSALVMRRRDGYQRAWLRTIPCLWLAGFSLPSSGCPPCQRGA